MTDYASFLGIKSLPAAIVFAILYVPLFAFFVSKAVARPNYVYIILALFSAIRITAFILRALLADDASVQDDLNVVIAYEIIYNTGFFGILYSAYILATDRVSLSPHPPNGPISRILRFRFLFRLALTAAVAIGITGAVYSSLGTTPSAINTGTTLREAAIYIFLICAILVLLQTYFLARVEFRDRYYSSNNQIGATYGVYFLLVISLLLVAREAFFTATATNTARQNNEAIWYPLSAVTEFLAVLLFTAPGLVPDPKDA
ncbi:hypothetical protein JVU11DRAFT_722 [Chiua virens]|nr:hypothetical protein JVU11DRAFT_722 [Chiua virens]